MAQTEIRPRLSSEHPWTPGSWFRWRAFVLMSCPGCGSVAGLDDHEIDDQGRVTPSVDCSECEYHETGVRLLEWEPHG